MIRKYTRVKKPPASTPITLLTASDCVTGTSFSYPIVTAVPLPVVVEDEDVTAKTFLHSTNVGDPTNNCGELLAYPSYVNRVDGLGKHFSSTTIIVNGAAVPQLDLTSHNNSVLVMPLDTLEVPVETLVTDDNQIQTIHVGEFSEVADHQNLHEEMFIAANDTSGTCYVTIERERPKKGITPVKKLYGKRGLIRLGKSRMIADSHTSIAVSEFKAQLNDTSDIIGSLDVAPSTKRLMVLLHTKGVNKLFANPGRKMGSHHTYCFTRHLTVRQTPAEELYDDMPLQPVGYVPQVDSTAIKRITRKRRYPEAEEYQRRVYNEQMQLQYFNDKIEIEGEEPDCAFFHEEVIIPDSQSQDGLLLDQIDIGDMNACNEVYKDVMTEIAQYRYREAERKQPPFLSEDDGENSTTEDTEIQENLEVLLAAAEKRYQCRDYLQQGIISTPEVKEETTV